MAEIAAFLPKWQALQILCQTPCQYGKKLWHDICICKPRATNKYFFGMIFAHSKKSFS